MSGADDSGFGAGGADEPQREPVGSVTEEAMKLLGALSGWAKDHGDGVGQGFAGMASGAAHAVHEVNEHIATGSAECQFCPVCRGVHAVRELSPEVKNHLAVAGASLMQAAAAFLTTHIPEQPRKPDNFEHIDLDGEWPEEP